MKTRLFIFVLVMGQALYAQIPVSNKGNMNQTYPKVTAVKPAIQAMVNQVSIPNLEGSIRWMQDLGCRDAMTQEALQTQNRLIDRFESFGLDVSVHYFSLKGQITRGRCTPPSPPGGVQLEAGNVIAIQYGTDFPDEYIVVSSHYDHHDGPGADDNASGTAGVLEIARILSQYQFKRSIIYVPFNAEEYGMKGSFPFAKKCAGEDMNILGCFNLDMLGFFPENAGALTMYAGGSDFLSKKLFEYYQAVANLYVTDIPTYRFSHLDTWGGDHMAFYPYDYPALYIGDVEYIAWNSCYHGPCDTLGDGVNSMRLVQGFTKAALAAVAELANGWLSPQNLRAVPENNGITVSWDAAPETSKYHLFRNNVFLTEVTNTIYYDTNVLDGMKYVYYVTGIRAGTDEESPGSNCDSAIFSLPMELPYFNDFEGTLADFNNNYQIWNITHDKAYSHDYSLASTHGGETPRTWCFSALELKPFTVPDITDRDLIMSFYIWEKSDLEKNPLAEYYVEATTDRHRWIKLAAIEASDSNFWRYICISLNNYIGKPFVQVRFRGGNLGKLFYIDDLSIKFMRPAPKNARIFARESNQTTIAWDPVDQQDVLGYNIYRDASAVKLNGLIITGTTYTTTATLPYCYQVTAVYPDGESALSNSTCYNEEVGIEEPTLSKVRISPNPSDGIVNIVTGLEQTYSVAVYTMYGNEVCRQEHFSDGFLDLSALSKGIYIVKIMTSQSHVAKKVVLQ